MSSTRCRTWIGVVLGVLATTGCPRRFDPRAEEVHSTNQEAEAEFNQARQRMQQGQTATAEKELAQFVARHGDDPLAPQATLLRARAALDLGQPAQARDLVAPLADVPSNQAANPATGPMATTVSPAIGARARYLLGLADYHLGDFAGARRLLQPFADPIVDSEDGTELHAVLADVLRREGDVPGALREYDRYFHGTGVRPAERAYVRGQAGRLIATLPAGEQAGPRQRFALNTPSASAAEQRMVVGLVLPLSGKERALGEHVLRGALLGAAAAALQTDPVGANSVPRSEAPLPSPLPLVDNRGASRFAMDLRVRDAAVGDVGARTGEVLAEGALALVGSPVRGDAAGLLAVARLHGTPVLELSPMASGERDEGAPATAAFHLLRSNAERARGLARHLLHKGVQTVAVLAPTTAYGKAMTRALAAELIGKPVRVVGQLSYAEGSTTFTAQAQQLLALRPEALFIPAPVTQLELIVAQLAASGVIPTQNVSGPRQASKEPVRLLLGTADGLGERLLRNAGRYLQGAVLAPISTGGLAVDEATMSDFAERYQRAYGEEPGALDALGHDAVRLVMAACQAGPAGGQQECSSARIAAALPNLTLSGATGPVCFDAGGQRAGGPLLVRIEGSGLRVIPPARQEQCGAPELRSKTAALDPPLPRLGPRPIADEP